MRNKNLFLSTFLVLVIATAFTCTGCRSSSGGGSGGGTGPIIEHVAEKTVLTNVLAPTIATIESMGGNVSSSMRAAFLGNSQENANLNILKNTINSTMDVNNLLNIIASVVPSMIEGGGLINTDNDDGEYQRTEANYEGNVLIVKRYKKGHGNDAQEYISSEMKIENCSATVKQNILKELSINNGAIITIKRDKRSSWPINWDPYDNRYVTSAKITVKGGISAKFSSSKPENVTDDRYFDWDGVERNLDNTSYWHRLLKAESIVKENTTFTLNKNLELTVSNVVYDDGTANHGSANIKITGISGDYTQITNKIMGKWGYINSEENTGWVESPWGPTEVTRHTNDFDSIKLANKVDVEVTGKWNEKGLEIKKVKTSLSGITESSNSDFKFKKYKVSDVSVDVDIGNSSYKFDNTYQNLQVKSAKANITGLKFDHDNPMNSYENAVVKVEAESLSGMKIDFNTDLKTKVAEINLENLVPVTDPKNDSLTFDFKSALVTAIAPGNSFGVSDWNKRFENTTFKLLAVERDGKFTERTYKINLGKFELLDYSDRVAVETNWEEIPDVTSNTTPPAGYEEKKIDNATCFISKDSRKATMIHENRGVTSNVKLNKNSKSYFSGKSNSILDRTPYNLDFDIFLGANFRITGNINELKFTAWGTKENLDIRITK